MKSTNFPIPCENEFEKMAEENPLKLKQWIESGELKPCDLTFAAEYFGIADSDLVCPTLLKLLDHPDSAVREGAVYGLSKSGKNHEGHLEYPGVMKKLVEVLENEPSPAVRDVIGGAISWPDD